MSDPFVKVYKNILPKKLCNKIIKMAEEKGFHQGKVGYGDGFVDRYMKRCMDYSIKPHEDSDWKEIDKEIHTRLGKALQKYSDDTNDSFKYISKNISDSGYLIQKYEANGSDGFNWHSDSTNFDSSYRFLACIFYLNTVEEGGETELMLRNINVKPKIGSLLLFPTGLAYTHRGKLPKSGPKYIVTSFMIYDKDSK